MAVCVSGDFIDVQVDEVWSIVVAEVTMYSLRVNCGGEGVSFVSGGVPKCSWFSRVPHLCTVHRCRKRNHFGLVPIRVVF